jgi:antitoxin component of MazEF toxin-antitoxin module
MYIHWIYFSGAHAMYKNFTKHGNSYALIIDKPIMELLGMCPDTPVEFTTDGKALTITAVKDPKRRAAVRRVMDRINRDYGRTMKKLAE